MAESMTAFVGARRWLDFAFGVGAGVSINLLSSLVEGRSLRIGALTAVLAAVAVGSLVAPGGWLASRVGPGYCADVVRWTAGGCMAVLLGLDVVVAAGRAAPVEGTSMLLAWWAVTSAVVWRLPSAKEVRPIKPLALGGLLVVAPMGVMSMRWATSGALWPASVLAVLAGAVLLGAWGLVAERWWVLRVAAACFMAAVLATAGSLLAAGAVSAAFAGALLVVAVGVCIRAGSADRV